MHHLHTTEIYFSQFWRPEVWDHSVQMHGQVRAIFSHVDLSSYPHMMEGVKELYGVCFIRNWFHPWGHPHDINTSLKPHILIPSPLGVRISAYDLEVRGGHEHSDHSILAESSLGEKRSGYINGVSGTSLAVQWLKLCLPIQGCRFDSRSRN